MFIFKKPKPKKIEDTYLIEYWKKIQKGEILVGIELKTLLSNLIEDLEDPRYTYDTSDADLRMDFMENCIKLTKSPFAGKPMKLMLWQKAFIEVMYSFKMADTGFDRFKKVILLISRKNTKSELCSALALTEAVFGNAGSDIVCSSNDDRQASILYNAINKMRLMIDPKEKDFHKSTSDITFNLNGSVISKISDKTRNKEGLNIDFAIVDEAHEMRENVIVKSIEQSMSLKDNPKLIIITTEGFVTDGYLDNELNSCRAILNKEDDGISAERILPWLYTQDSEQEVWQDPKTWVKSNPSLGTVKKWDYLYEQIDLARKSKKERIFVLSKDFNFKVSGGQAWLFKEDYDNGNTFDIEDFRNSVCLGSVDLSRTTDLTSAKIMLFNPENRKKYIHSMYWIPQSKFINSDDKTAGAQYEEWKKQGKIRVVPDNDIDSSIVADWFKEIYDEYEIKLLHCGYDQWGSNDFKKRMKYYGIKCSQITQNMANMSDAMNLVEADFKSGLINYNDNPVDKWCLENTCVKLDDNRNCMYTKAQVNKRIDGAVTLIMLYKEFKEHKTEFIKYCKAG